MLEGINHTIILLSKILKRVTNNLAHASAEKSEKLPAMWLPKSCICERKSHLYRKWTGTIIPFLYFHSTVLMHQLVLPYSCYFQLCSSYTWLQVSGKIRPAFQISLMAVALVSFIHKMNRSRWFLELNLPISIPQLSPHRVTLNTLSRILEGDHAIEQWSLKGTPTLFNS